MGEFLDGYLHAISRPTRITPAENSANNHIYSSFEEWYIVFKKSAAKANNELSLNHDGSSLIDFMDKTPLKRAFRDGINPASLGIEFASQFDFSSFCQR